MRREGLATSWCRSRSPSSHCPLSIRRRDGSRAAGREGSRNLIGIKDPAIDKLVDHVIFAKNREELVAATNALDRVLLWNDFVVPQWYAPKVRIAYWDRYGQPATLPGLTPGFTQVWWFDKSLAAKLPGASKL